MSILHQELDCIYTFHQALYITEAILQRHLQSDISDIRQYWVTTMVPAR